MELIEDILKPVFNYRKEENYKKLDFTQSTPGKN